MSSAKYRLFCLGFNVGSKHFVRGISLSGPDGVTTYNVFHVTGHLWGESTIQLLHALYSMQVQVIIISNIF